jgi:hypothetical protein
MYYINDNGRKEYRLWACLSSHSPYENDTYPFLQITMDGLTEIANVTQVVSSL